MSVLNYSHVDGVATITLNNPPQNRLASELMQSFGEAVMDIAGRKETRVVYIKSEGPDFSFGGDIAPWKGIDGKVMAETLAQGIHLANIFENLPVPIVVAVQGHCRGGGFELALRGDIIIAADNALFGHSEATIGVFTFLGGVQRVAERVGRTRAIEWAMSAEMIGARQAHDVGLINDVVPLGDLYATADSWVQKFSGGATLAHAAHKKLLRAWSTGGVRAADDLMATMSGDIIVSEDVQNSLVGAIEALEAGKPRPVFPFKGR